jgi:eukaryotic-like serine/threonine-protein kinase
MPSIEPPSSSPVRVGEILDGKYRVERLLGAGGMGAVVAAMHLELHHMVALKMILPDAMHDEEAVERFERESRAAVRLKSEHAVRVLDVGRMPNGAPYMVMEFLEGHDLGSLDKTSPLEPSVAVDYVLQACEALAEAHSMGIVHRDIKPRNLFLTKRVDGKPLVKVLDFGLAKNIHPSMSGAVGLTKTRTVMGSPQYMSPEQMRSSRDIDFRTDIWSLGVCAFELLTGQVPFDAPTVPEICAMVLKEPPRSLREIRPDISPELEAAVLRCLEKDPKDRFADVAELARALEEAAGVDGRRSREISARVHAVLRSSGPQVKPAGTQSIVDAHAKTRTASAWGSGDAVRPRMKPLRLVGLIGIFALGALTAISLVKHHVVPDPATLGAVPTNTAQPALQPSQSTAAPVAPPQPSAAAVDASTEPAVETAHSAAPSAPRTSRPPLAKTVPTAVAAPPPPPTPKDPLDRP